MAEKKQSGARTRNYATVVYPDSENTKENWQAILGESKVASFISPLHDQDKNPTGEPKKPHYHVLLMFEGPKTIEQAKEVFDTIGGVGCETVNSMRGYSRYLCHLDNPEKAQYDPEHVRSLCGADYMAAIGLPTDKYKAIREMMAWCKEYNVDSYHEVLEYAAEQRMDWFRVLCDSGTMVIKEYLKSKSWKERVQAEYAAEQTKKPH